MSRRYNDEELIPRKSNNEHHLQKRKQRNKALEIVFDPSSHKEYVTGFRKRKQQRRKEALKQLEKKQRQQRLEERAERRQEMRDQLHIEDNQNDTDNDDDHDDNNDNTNPSKKVKVFTSNELISTVTVQEMKTNSDSDREDDIKHHHHTKGQQQQSTTSNGGGSGQPGSKLSKNALKVMERTRLKIQGKKVKRSGGKGGSGKGGRGGHSGSGGGGGKRKKGR